MIYTMYSIQDTMIGFNAPYLMINEDVAKREYNNFLKKTPNPTDMRLFKIATFDDATGTVVPIVPEMIMGGGEQHEI